MLTISNHGSHTMTLDQGNLQNCKRAACGPQPALHCGGVDLMYFCLVPCASLERQNLSPLTQPPGTYRDSHHWSGDPAGDEGCWKATDMDCPAAQTCGTRSRSCLIKTLHSSLLWIAIVLPMEKRHIVKLGRAWKPCSHTLALALKSGVWKGSKSSSNGWLSWADRRRRHVSSSVLHREPVTQIASKTVQKPSHKVFSKIAIGISAVQRGPCNAGFLKRWNSWVLRRDTVLEVNRGSNVLFCTPASNNLFPCWILHFSFI